MFLQLKKKKSGHVKRSQKSTRIAEQFRKQLQENATSIHKCTLENTLFNQLGKGASTYFQENSNIKEFTSARKMA